MKRALALLMALIMVMCAVASCGGGGNKNTSDSTGTTNTTNTTNTTETPDIPKEVPPVLWLDFEEENVDGDVINNVVGDSELNAELMGEVEYVEGANGGKAVYFPATDDINYLYIFNNEKLNFTKDDEFTIDFWYMIDAKATVPGNLFQKGSAENGWYGVWLNENGVCLKGDMGEGKIASADSKKWHHVTIVQKEGLVYLVLDGERVGIVKAVDLTSASDLFIGGNGAKKEDSAQFVGAIDEFKIYDYAHDNVKTGADIAEQDKNAPAETAGKAPVLSLDFEDLANMAGATVVGTVENIAGPNGGKAAYFKASAEEGVTNYIQVPNSDALNFTPEDEFTIDFWYMVDLGAQGWDNLFQKGESGKGWYGVWLGNNDSYGVCWGGDTGNYKTGPLDSYVWHRMTIVQKGGILYTYIDGERVTAIQAKNFTSTTDLYIGGGSQVEKNIQQFEGAIDDFKVYDYAMNITEGAMTSEQNPDALKETAGKGPVLSLDFEDLANMTGATVTGTVTNVAGPNGGKAAQFGNGYITVPNSDAINFTTADEFTIDFWYMLDFSAAGWDTLFAKGSSGNGWYGVWLGQNDNTNQGVCWGGDTGNNKIGSINSKYMWHRITVTMKNGQISTYLDGTLVKTFAAKEYTSDTALTIGANADGSGLFNGAIDEFKIYDYAFVPEYVAPTVAEQDANAPVATEGKGPVLSLDFEDLANMTGATVTGTIDKIAGPNGGNAAHLGNGYITVPNSDAINFAIDAEFTVDFWCMIDTGAVGWDTVFVKGSSKNGWYGVWLGSNGDLFWGGDTGNKAFDIAGSQNEWHRITVIQKGGVVYTYLDGAYVTEFYSVEGTSDTALTIGANADGTQPFNGAIDDFKVYNYAFDMAEE